MSVAGTVITVGVLYVAFRAAIRPKKPDPMAGRLVPRDPSLTAGIVGWHKHRHDTFAARHTVNFNQPPPPEPAPYDRLAAYRPRARHEEL